MQSLSLDKAVYAIGVMSGTSLDGIDLALCKFWQENAALHYEILAAETIPYTPEWKERLRNVENASARELAQTHAAYGHLLGKQIKQFMDKQAVKPQFVASHGHTIFHQPAAGYTTQIGDGAAIYAECGCCTVCDFRTVDVALGGEGAPLVPIGDRLLFAQYDACLNLGGFANISYDQHGQRIAGDICPANIALNHYAETLGYAFDRNGELAAQGKVNTGLLDQLNQLPFYAHPFPRSLGKEWLLSDFLPMVEACPCSTADKMRTIVEHIAYMVSRCTPIHATSMLITGGGAHNAFLINRLQSHLPNLSVVLPSPITIEYKEALVFAFLGLLRLQHLNNCLAEVTGAAKDNIGGCVYGG